MRLCCFCSNVANERQGAPLCVSCWSEIDRKVGDKQLLRDRREYDCTMFDRLLWGCYVSVAMFAAIVVMRWRSGKEKELRQVEQNSVKGST